MPTNISTEHNDREQTGRVFGKRYIPISEACTAFPHGKVSRASLERWWRHGVRGAVLQTYVIGHRRFTTLRDIREFIAAQQSPMIPVSCESSTSTRRQREILAAEEKVRKTLSK